jgi:hypothetical protein
VAAGCVTLIPAAAGARLLAAGPAPPKGGEHAGD